MTAEDTPKTAAWRSPAFIAAILFLATAGLYARVETFEFVNYDDPGYVYSNAHVKAGLTGKTLVWAFTTRDQGNWHPLAWLSHALDWQVFGDWAGGHHLTSALIHAVTTALVFVWLFRATGAVWPSAIVAAVFGWHPLHVESVAWVAERKDVLCAFFFVLGLICYTEYRRGSRARWYAAVTTCFVFALLSKPMAVTFPFVVFLVDVWPLKTTRIRVAEKCPWIALSVVHSVVTYIVQQAGENTVGLHSVPLRIRLENAAASYATYAWKTVWPAGLGVFYPYPPHGPALWHWVGGAAFVIGGSILAVVLVRRAPFVFSGWFWFIGMLLPVIGLVQVGTQSHADRYMYLPQIGLVVVAVWGFASAARASVVWRAGGAAVAAIMLMTYPLVTSHLLPTWRHSFALFERALDVTENNATANVNLGVAYYNVANYDKAAEHTAEALRINPNEFNALMNMGLIETKRERWNESEKLWRAALAVNPSHAEAHSFLGQALEEQGDVLAAANEYTECVRLDPGHVRGHELLGGSFLQLGNGAEAEGQYRRAIELDGTRAGSWASLGVALCTQNRFAESLPKFQQALELDPANADARYFYAKALAATGDSQGALKQLGVLLAQHPEHPDALALEGELEGGAK